MESLRISTKFPTTFTLVDRLNEIQAKSGGINFKDFVEGL
jgi:hypothetical protein